jgi:hypothetical protein
MVTQSIVNITNEGLTVGRGQVLFARLTPDLTLPKNPAFEHIGNCPGFSLSVESPTLDHFSSERGIGEKDASITLQTNRTATLECDNIRAENIARFLYGEVQTVTQAAATVTADPITDVRLGTYIKLDMEMNQTGAVNIDPTSLVVTSDDVTPVTYVLGEDYLFDAERGMIRFLASGDVSEGDTVLVSYDVLESSFTRITSGSEPISVAVLYIAENPIGPSRNVLMRNVKVRPEGELAFISGDDWATISLNLEVLLDPVYNTAVFLDGNPTTL